MKKKIIIVILCLSVVGIGIYGCYIYYHASHLKISDTNILLAKGIQKQISLNTKSKTKWESDNPTIASISPDGKVKAVKKGTTIIRGKAFFRTLKCKVKVEDPYVEKTSVFLTPNSVKKITVFNNSQKVTWTSTNRNIFVKHGMIYAKEPSVGEVSARIPGRTFLIHVNVLETILPRNNRADKNVPFDIVLNNSSDKNIQWKVKDKNILKIIKTDGNHLTVEGINVGKTKVTAKAHGKKYVQKVWVTGDQGLSIEGNDVLLGEECKLSIKNYVPSYKVTWEGVKESEKETATIDTSQRGTFHVKAKVDTGISTEEIKKDITIREKVLNMTTWDAGVGESTDIIMQDAVKPEYKCDSNIIKIEGTKITALEKGTATLHVIDGETDLTCTINIKGNNPIIHSIEKLRKLVVDNEFIYSNSGVSKSFDEALNGNRKSNCALLVSFALQDAGYLPPGKTIYYKDGLRGGGASDIESNPNLEVTYPDKEPRECGLKEGDVCGFMLSGGRVPHMAIFAGYSDDGDLLWYTGGRDATDKKTHLYESYEKIGPRTQHYYNEVQILIRVK